jgi:hypothetical protein
MGALALTFALTGCDVARPSARAAEPETDATPPVPVATADGPALAPIPIRLEAPPPKRTPANVPPDVNVRKGEYKPRPPFMAPVGVKNVALGRPVACSDEEPIIGNPEQITDGDKVAGDGGYVEFGPGTQHVTVDLGAVHEVYAAVVWHRQGDMHVYHDVVVRIAADPDFIAGVKTLYNNDHDNSSGLGLGRNFEYFETSEGLLVDAGGVKTRYVRIYSNGSTVDEMNRYSEVEVYGLPVR